MSSSPPPPPLAGSPALQHAGIQTTTSALEAAPENLLVRGYNKRSLAALEPEFVDNSDINAMAPSSAILQSDFLVKDDNHNLDDKVDMADRVILSHAPLSPPAPLPKRVRYAPSNNEPTAADYALLNPVIQPSNEEAANTHHTRSRSSSSSPSSTSDSSSRPNRPHSVSRRRSIADLVPSSGRRTSVLMDEPEATTIYGEPVDSSSAGLAMDISDDEPPAPPALASTYPGSSKLTAGNAARRNSVSSAKKGIQRPVRIQLLDKAESEQIREQARRDSVSSDMDQDQQDQEDDHDSDSQERRILQSRVDDQSDVALQKEDPAVHDWDKEELDDEENSSATPSSMGESPMPYESTERRRSIANDIRRAAGTSGAGTEESKHSSRRSGRGASSRKDRDDDEDDDHWDPLLDPEREVAVMTEDQEAELHNVHLRLENQRDFQDAASLDLGEDDAQAVNEDGQYGGAIEDDDEGEDYWENR
ncbi:hypothetical protein EDD11_001516 [Mortierella claussenii]|nr:hypothetical protein EDD11_001516 [Mortierella claussenii]